MDQNNTNMTFPPSTVNESSAPPGCLVLHFKDFPPWDNPLNLISAHVEDLVRRWKDAIFLPVLFLIGGPANVINMAVFYKQGLRERINVCLFALSLADFLFLLQTFLLNCENVQFDKKDRYGLFATFFINHNLTGLYGFYWVSMILSAIIASERCFCILRPLHSHTFISTSTTTTIIIAISIVVVGVYFLVVSKYRILCVYDPVSDTTFNNAVAGEFYLAHQTLIDYLDVYVYGGGLPGVMMVVVVVTTVLTKIKLREAAVWRTGRSSGEGLSSKEIALTKMLVCISLLFIASAVPSIIFRFVWLYLPDLKLGGSQHNLFMVGLWLLDVFAWINSTFNIVVYFLMGSRYRHTLRTLMGREGRTARGKNKVAMSQHDLGHRGLK